MNILIIIGTRPEAIKMAILYKLLLDNESFSVCMCLTGQHKELCREALDYFGLQADLQLDIDLENKSMLDKMATINEGLRTVISDVKPDLILAHGDTLSAYCAAHIAFFNGIKLAHVEAGLRSYNAHRPFPEELIRKNIKNMADLHFAPSKNARENLLNEGVLSKHIFVTGNTGIDALKYLLENNEDHSPKDDKLESFINNQKIVGCRKILLLTMHRRENQEFGIAELYASLSDIVKKNSLAVICIEHPNPKARAKFKDDINEQVYVSSSVTYPDFIYLMENADLILTDSGGIQEEAPYLGKPIIVLRTETERKEIIDGSNSVLYHIDNLENDINRLLASNHEVRELYGDGSASNMIVRILEKNYLE